MIDKRVRFPLHASNGVSYRAVQTADAGRVLEWRMGSRLAQLRVDESQGIVMERAISSTGRPLAWMTRPNVHAVMIAELVTLMQPPVPESITVRYHAGARPDARARFAEYLRVCIDSFETGDGGARLGTVE